MSDKDALLLAELTSEISIAETEKAAQIARKRAQAAHMNAIRRPPKRKSSGTTGAWRKFGDPPGQWRKKKKKQDRRKYWQWYYRQKKEKQNE